MKTVYMCGFTSEPEQSLCPWMKVFGVAPSKTKAEEWIAAILHEDGDPLEGDVVQVGRQIKSFQVEVRCADERREDQVKLTLRLSNGIHLGFEDILIVPLLVKSVDAGVHLVSKRRMTLEISPLEEDQVSLNGDEGG